jgi:hypothetical protein
VEVCGDAHVPRPLIDVPPQRRVEAEIVERYWPQFHRQTVNFFVDQGGVCLQFLDLRRQLVGVGDACSQGVESHSERRQMLAKAIV